MSVKDCDKKVIYDKILTHLIAVGPLHIHLTQQIPKL